jgi:rRNA maturation RNase YbeY
VSQTLILRERIPARAIDLRMLRRLVEAFLTQLLHRDFTELGIYVVSVTEITSLNEAYLQHRGPTDVIAFNYAAEEADPLAGEIFICLEEVRRQSRRFRVSWQKELVRYIVHGVLHLCGYDDKTPSQRARMKREENRLLRLLADRFALADLARSTNRQ